MMEDFSEMISDKMSDDYTKPSAPKSRSESVGLDFTECSQSVGFSTFHCKHCPLFFNSTELLTSHMELEHEQIAQDLSTSKVNKTEKQTSLLHYLREKINIMESVQKSEESELNEQPMANNLEAASYMYSLQTVAGVQQLYCLMCSFVCDSHDIMQSHFAQKHVKSGLLELLIASTLGNRKYGANSNNKSSNEKENPRIHHIRKENISSEYIEKDVFPCHYCSMKFNSMILLDIHNAQQHEESAFIKSNKNSVTLDNEILNRQSKSKGKFGKMKAVKHLGHEVPLHSKPNSNVFSRLEEVQARMTINLILKDSSEDNKSSSGDQHVASISINEVTMQNSSNDYNFKTRDRNQNSDPSDECNEDNKRLHCQQCSFTTISLKRLQHHYYQKHDLCNQELNVEIGKSEAVSFHPNDANFLSCSVSTSSQHCDKLIQQKGELSSSDQSGDDKDNVDDESDGFNIGQADDVVTCKKCFKPIKRCDLEQHNLEKHEIGDGNYECKQCFKRFQLKKDLNAHSKIHNKLSKIHKCKYCAKVYVTAAALSLHLKTKHADSKPFICKYCGKIFAKSCEQQLHQQIHAGEKSYKCSSCGRSFLTKVILSQHMKTHSGDTSKHKCSNCSKTFSSVALLEIHACSPGKEFPFKCEFCEKVFKTKKLAEVHTWTHSKEKLFKCEFCSKTFRTSGQVTVHRRSHTSDKPYVCNVCCKTFASSAQLLTHQKTHS